LNILADNRNAEADPFDLQRFVGAQSQKYEAARAELREGRKQTHWMWFVFPQMRGLGFSSMANLYGIASRAEAEAYLAHPALGPRLREETRLVNAIAENRRQDRRRSQSTAHDIFGSPDDLKFRSSMTLFAAITAKDDVFQQALDRYFGGEPDAETLRMIA